LTKLERKKIQDSLELALYIDTFKIKLTDIEKYDLIREKTSRLAKYADFTLYLLSASSYFYGMMSGIIDSTHSRAVREKSILFISAGAIGVITSFICIHYIMHKDFYIRKWTIRID
jgi:hypothetical protein